jgi:hypothetical protein
MKRVSVMANDAVLVDAIASILAVEISPDVLQLTYRLPGSVYESIPDRRSMVIVIDEGESEIKFLKGFDSVAALPLLVIKADLKTMNIDIHESYQLMSPAAELVTHLVRQFRRRHLGSMDEKVVSWAS